LFEYPAHTFATSLKHSSICRQHAHPFAQAAAQAAGEGIGLSIVKRLCEALDATLEVKSDARSNRKFTILLPKS
jgi:nitrogen-specific signal transduction histidine kinase